MVYNTNTTKKENAISTYSIWFYKSNLSSKCGCMYSYQINGLYLHLLSKIYLLLPQLYMATASFKTFTSLWLPYLHFKELVNFLWESSQAYFRNYPFIGLSFCCLKNYAFRENQLDECFLLYLTFTSDHI